MTVPSDLVGGPGRLPIPVSPGQLALLARNTAFPVPDSPISMMAAVPLLKVTADHLSLIRGLILAGQTTRAMELLQAVWHPQEPEEHCWYLRLWIVTAAGRVSEALELSRVATRELPGSAGVAYLQSVLEQAEGSPVAAREAATRAAAIAPEHPLPATLLAPANVTPSPLLAAQLGTVLLFPLGSGLALRPQPSRGKPGARGVKPVGAERRRLGFISLAMAGATLLAIRYPVPAALGLALIVGWALRPRRVTTEGLGSGSPGSPASARSFPTVP